VERLNLVYDKAGRSEGTAYVIYERPEDAKQAVQDYNGANANGAFICWYPVTNLRLILL